MSLVHLGVMKDLNSRDLVLEYVEETPGLEQWQLATLTCVSG